MAVTRASGPVGAGRRLSQRPVTLHPAQVIVTGFAAAVLLGTALLSLPVARAGRGSATLVEALFTATSAVSVTGLVVVDTGSYWSPFGHAVILGLIQLGGFGIMTSASLAGLLISRRLGLRQRLTAATEMHSLGLGDVRRVVVGVARVSAVVQGAAALLLALRFVTAYDEPPLRAAWLGLFHAVSAFNNAGFALWDDNLVRFAHDPVVLGSVLVAVVLGGLGFPVLLELRRELRRPDRWSLHTRITVLGTALLLAAGTALVLASEWRNPRTLGPLGTPGKLLAGVFSGAMPRTAGFNSLDVAAMTEATWFGSTVLMFIGGGSASTAGGIKVSTAVVLALIVAAEVRGRPDVRAFHRRIPTSTQRQAVAVTVVAGVAVLLATLYFTATAGSTLSRSLFEVVSAFGTVGLSTGITDALPTGDQVVLVLLMFTGRVGPVTLATALALRRREVLYRYPEERVVIG